ncbi:MAG: polyprenyl synthetase family protein, partial [Pseudomonadota bacterium]|nr:polyprenyl synthetase family protein [Pseudomonadota bacterium]
LDYISNKKKFGKVIGEDFRSGKMSLPVILAYSRGNEKERSFWHKTMEEKKQTPRDFKKAIRIMNLRNAIEDSVKRAQFFASIAIDSLRVFPDSFEKQALQKIVNFSINRSY